MNFCSSSQQPLIYQTRSAPTANRTRHIRICNLCAVPLDHVADKRNSYFITLQLAYFNAEASDGLPSVPAKLLHLRVISGQNFPKPRGGGKIYVRDAINFIAFLRRISAPNLGVATIPTQSCFLTPIFLHGSAIRMLNSLNGVVASSLCAVVYFFHCIFCCVDGSKIKDTTAIALNLKCEM